MKYLLLPLTALLANAAQAADRFDCSAVWAANDGIVEMERSVPLSPIFPDLGIHPDFTIVGLQTTDGDLFRPRDLAEAVCALRRMLDERTVGLTIEGIQRFVELSPRTPQSDDEFSVLRESIDESLSRINRQDPVVTTSLISTIYFEMSWQFGIRTAVLTEYPDSPLQQFALSQGIYSPSTLQDWVWVSFLGDLDVAGFDSESILEYVRSLDADLAPPQTLNVSACPDPLSYEWRTSTAAASTFADPDYLESVHWGVCPSLRTLWVYHYRYGWIEANAEDREYICGSDANPPYLDSYCDASP